MSYVYLLHFDQPISERHTCQNYIGYTDNLSSRIKDHTSGNGARLTQVARERGIKFTVARVWKGTRELERKLKNRKNGNKLYNGATVSYADELSQDEIELLLSDVI